MESSKSIRLVSHVRGSPRVTAPIGFNLELIEPLKPELDPPTALRTVDRGKLVVIENDASRPETPLILASKGGVADLHDKQDLIETAKSAGRSVEVHVFDDIS